MRLRAKIGKLILGTGLVGSDIYYTCKGIVNLALSSSEEVIAYLSEATGGHYISEADRYAQAAGRDFITAGILILATAVYMYIYKNDIENFLKYTMDVFKKL